MTTTLAEQVAGRRTRRGTSETGAFKGLSTGAGLVILVALAGVAVFLVQQGWPALTATGDAGLRQGQHRSVRLAAAVRHPAGGRAVDPDRRAAGDRGGAGHLPLRSPPGRQDAGLSRRPAGGGAQRRLRTVGHRLPASNGSLPIYRWLEDNLGFVPFFAGPATTGRTILTAVGGAGDHGAADHHRDLPRGLRADPDHPPGGGAGARGDPLGDDPDDGLPLLPLRRRLGDHARPRPRAGRDHGRRDGAVGHRRRHLQPDLQRRTPRRSRPTSRSTSATPPASRSTC